MSSILYLLYSFKKSYICKKDPTWFRIYKILLKLTNQTQKNILKNGIVYYVLMSRRLTLLEVKYLEKHVFPFAFWWHHQNF